MHRALLQGQEQASRFSNPKTKLVLMTHWATQDPAAALILSTRLGMAAALACQGPIPRVLKPFPAGTPQGRPVGNAGIILGMTGYWYDIGMDAVWGAILLLCKS